MEESGVWLFLLSPSSTSNTSTVAGGELPSSSANNEGKETPSSLDLCLHMHCELVATEIKDAAA
jgi:hypothetical protein